MSTLDKVNVDLMVVLGTSTMPIHQVMRLSRGAIIELDASEADEVKILANNMIPGQCRPISGTRTFSTPLDTPNWHRTDSRISGDNKQFQNRSDYVDFYEARFLFGRRGSR